MRCVLSAESAILVYFHSVRMILLLLSKEIVTLFALGTSQSDFGTLCSHGYSPPKNIISYRLIGVVHAVKTPTPVFSQALRRIKVTHCFVFTHSSTLSE